MDLPDWVYKAVSLIVIWLLGQIVIEWIKIKMRKSAEETVVKSEWTGNERRHQTFTIDEILLQQFLAAYQEHVALVRKLNESSQTQNNLMVSFVRNFDEHALEEAKSRRMLRALHDHFNLMET